MTDICQAESLRKPQPRITGSFGRWRINDRNSVRVSSSLRKQPSMDDVTADGVLLLDAAHHHAQMPGFDDDADALRFDGVLDGLGDLRGQALLDLQAAREQLR